MKLVKVMRCDKCEKIVGFAEAVHRDDKVFHRDCYRCATCNKRLQRGYGLTHQGQNYCHKCHAQQFGPTGFRPGVNVNRSTIRRVAMKMQPPFAHTSVNIKKELSPSQFQKAKEVTTAGAGKLHHFDVALFTGTTAQELEHYLLEGQVDVKKLKWPKGALEELLAQLKEGKSELGLDPSGKALRVASVVKALVHDNSTDAMLFNPLNSHEQSAFDELDYQIFQSSKAKDEEANVLDAALGCLVENTYPEVLEQANFSIDHVPVPIHDFIYSGVFESLGFNNVAASGFTSQLFKNDSVEIPAALVLETTFSTLNETPRMAAARLFSSRFSMKHATDKIFSKVQQRKKKTHMSARFPGLNSEYHIHYVLLKSQLIKTLQKSLPLDKVTPVERTTDKDKLNTNWYVWLKVSGNGNAVLKDLKAKYDSNSRVKELVGEVDFNGMFAQEMAQVMVEEMKALDLWN